MYCRCHANTKYLNAEWATEKTDDIPENHRNKCERSPINLKMYENTFWAYETNSYINMFLH